MDDQGAHPARGSSRRAILAATRTQNVWLSTATTSHRQLDATVLAEAGISEGLLRVSVGLEDVEDLVVDFAVGLAAARSAVPA